MSMAHEGQDEVKCGHRFVSEANDRTSIAKDCYKNGMIHTSIEETAECVREDALMVIVQNKAFSIRTTGDKV